MTTFDTVLVANRGEIAVRVFRTLRAMGIRSVAIYSDADRDALHVAQADVAVRIGPAAARDSYLSIDRVIAACQATNAQAVHPGYGFLSENAAFAEALAAAGIVFIGPTPDAIHTMGDKIRAKQTVSAFGVATVPGVAAPGLSNADLIAAAASIPYPILVKPSAGGGGKGMRIVERSEDLPSALDSARRESAASFGDDTLFLERFVARPRHIEVQILADQHGTVVHLGERECSLQRRHQKVVEEAPSPLLDEATRARIGTAACDTARSVDYTGAGTVEFIVSADQPDEFFFMEMNTRLQVEHPVTELVTGIDLVEWQVRVAAGEALPFAQKDIHVHGHAIEARVYAEDPSRDFLPTGGRVSSLQEASGPGIRVDSALRTGTVVGSDYDPMLAKVIAFADNRAAAVARLDQALADTSILGVQTNVAFLRHLLADEDVRAGRLDTALLDRIASDFQGTAAPDRAFLAAAADLWITRWSKVDPLDLWSTPDGWRLGETAPWVFRLSCRGRDVELALSGSPDAGWARIGDAPAQPLECRSADGEVTLIVDGLRQTFTVAQGAGVTWVRVDAESFAVTQIPEERRRTDLDAASSVITSPMPGTVVAVFVEDGSAVEARTPLLAVEAMKMEHQLPAPHEGNVELLVAVGDRVDVDQPLARIHAIPGSDGDGDSLRSDVNDR